MEFAPACKGLGVRPITGAELTLEGGAHLTLLVESAAGYRNLCRLLTAAHSHTRDGAQRAAAQPWVTLEAVEAHAEGLVCLSGCARDGAARGRLGARRDGRRRRRSDGGCWRPSAATASGSSCSVPTGAATGRATAGSRGSPSASASPPSRPATSTPTTAAAPPSRTPSSRSGWGRPSRPRSRAAAATRPRCWARRGAMAERFAEHPRGGRRDPAPRRAPQLRPDRGARLPLPRLRGPRRRPRPGRGSAGPASTSATRAARPAAREAEGRLEEELATIRHLRLSGFFLLHRDLLELAREVALEVRGPDSARSVLPPGRGRGSSVSSIVCYLTGLSHVDPVKAELFAGRFLNEEVASVPDIDLDFPRDIREVLIPRVHERYGADRSALVAAFPTYRPRGAVRDLGKALALPAEEIDRVAKTLGFHERAEEIERDVGRRDRRAARRLAGLAHPDRSSAPRRSACPATLPAPGRDGDLDPAADRRLPGGPGGDGGAPDRPVGQGLLRRRRLPQDRPARPRDALRGRALRRGGRPRPRASGSTSRGSRSTTAQTFESIQAAETTGVFQIESRAQMQMLPRTLPRDLDDLTVQVALVRPGPIQGGAIHPYIERRKRQREDPGFEIPYDHPLLEGVLEETLGTIVFQEQVIEVAMALSGFSSSEAEGLRRAMSRKRSEAELRRYHGRFLAGAAERGVGETDRRSGSGSRSRASPASASRRRTRPPSGCSPTSRPGCGSTTRRSSSARCSTSSRWASTRPTRWSTRRSGAGCGSPGPTPTAAASSASVERERGGLARAGRARLRQGGAGGGDGEPARRARGGRRPTRDRRPRLARRRRPRRPRTAGLGRGPGRDPGCGGGERRRGALAGRGRPDRPRRPRRAGHAAGAAAGASPARRRSSRWGSGSG